MLFYITFWEEKVSTFDHIICQHVNVLVMLGPWMMFSYDVSQS
ncbi:hypothetical protein DsansV1_C14g0130951 [Dioscorea sansibarensis]